MTSIPRKVSKAGPKSNLSWLVYVIGVLIVCGCIFLYIVSLDIPQVNDADVILAPVALVPQAENAYYFLPATDTLTEVDKELLRAQGETVVTPAMQQLAIETRPLTDAFIIASDKPGYQCPTTANSFAVSAEPCSLGSMRDLAYLTALRAQISLTTGDTVDALASSVAIVKMANLLASQPSIPEQLVSITLYNIPVTSLQAILDTDTAGIKSTVANELKLISPDPLTIATAFQGEYMSYKQLLTEIETGTVEGAFKMTGAEPSYRWQPNRTLDEMAGLQRMNIEYASTECGQGQELAENIEQAVMQIRNQGQSFVAVMPNGAGRIMNAVYVGSLINLVDKACETREVYRELL